MDDLDPPRFRATPAGIGRSSVQPASWLGLTATSPVATSPVATSPVAANIRFNRGIVEPHENLADRSRPILLAHASFQKLVETNGLHEQRRGPWIGNDQRIEFGQIALGGTAIEIKLNQFADPLLAGPYIAGPYIAGPTYAFHDLARFLAGLQAALDAFAKAFAKPGERLIGGCHGNAGKGRNFLNIARLNITHPEQTSRFVRHAMQAFLQRIQRRGRRPSLRASNWANASEIASIALGENGACSRLERSQNCLILFMAMPRPGPERLALAVLAKFIPQDKGHVLK